MRVPPSIMGNVDNKKVDRIIPRKEEKRLKYKRARTLYAAGYSYNQIVVACKMSKRDVFLAVNAKKKTNNSNRNKTKK